MSGAMSTSGVKIFTIEGVKLVSGLQWKKLNDRNYKKQALADGRSAKFDMVAVRKRGNVAQAGYAARGLTKQLKGAYSIAALLAAKLEYPFIGAFEIQDGLYAVVGVAPDGGIMAGLDDVRDRASAEDELREAYGLLSSDPSFAKSKRVYAPADFGFATHSDLSLSEVIGNPKKISSDHRMQSVAEGFGVRGALMMVGALLLVVGIAGGYAWKRHKEKVQLGLARAAELAQQQELAQKARDAAAAEAKEREARAALAKPWLNAPRGTSVLEACALAEASTTLSIAGWAYASASCDANGLVATYRRGASFSAPVAQFAQSATSQFGHAPAIGDSGESGTVTFPIQLSVLAPEQLQDRDALITTLTSRIQALNSEGLVAFTYSEKLFTATEDKDAPVQDWRTSEYTIVSRLPPLNLLSGMDLTGLYVTRIDNTISPEAELTWTITGEIYGR